MFVVMYCFGMQFLPLHSRQFQHRVKGIGMASFTPEEVAELENGGNKVVIYLRFPPTSPFLYTSMRAGWECVLLVVVYSLPVGVADTLVLKCRFFFFASSCLLWWVYCVLG